MSASQSRETSVQNSNTEAQSTSPTSSSAPYLDNNNDSNRDGGHHRPLSNNDENEQQEQEQQQQQQQETHPDPYRIKSRFIKQSRLHFREALTEIQAGRKASCWSWYFFPVAPWVVNGVERGSFMNQEYCLRDLPPNTKVGYDACRAYLRYPTTNGVNLRQNYIDIIKAVGDQLERGVKPVSLVGFLDEPKLRSSLRLFEKVSRENNFDPEVQAVASRAMKLMKEEPDE